jgi:hypothetical protein
MRNLLGGVDRWSWRMYMYTYIEMEVKTLCERMALGGDFGETALHVEDSSKA